MSAFGSVSGSALVSCALAGLFGSLSGTLGKLAASEFICSADPELILSFDPTALSCAVLRIGMLVANFVCGGTMWVYYIRGMNASSSVTGTVAVNAASTLFTAILGFMVFSEKPNAMWLLGAVCIGGGLALMAPGMQAAKSTEKRSV